MPCKVNGKSFGLTVLFLESFHRVCGQYGCCIMLNPIVRNSSSAARARSNSAAVKLTVSPDAVTDFEKTCITWLASPPFLQSYLLTAVQPGGLLSRGENRKFLEYSSICVLDFLLWWFWQFLFDWAFGWCKLRWLLLRSIPCTSTLVWEIKNRSGEARVACSGARLLPSNEVEQSSRECSW